MSSEAGQVRLWSVYTILVAVVGSALGIVSGCGSAQQTGSEQPEVITPVASTARFEYRIDSLASENRRARQQLEALATENRSLTGRNAELEMKLKDATAAPPPAPKAAPPKDLSAGYSAALTQYRKRDFNGAITSFEALLAAGIREDLADNCHYWIGESYYGIGKYTDAIGHFETARGYKHTEKRDDAQLMIGNCYAMMGKKDAAREAYNKVITSYPASPYVRKAQEKLARLK